MQKNKTKDRKKNVLNVKHKLVNLFLSNLSTFLFKYLRSQFGISNRKIETRIKLCNIGHMFTIWEDRFFFFIEIDKRRDGEALE